MNNNNINMFTRDLHSYHRHPNLPQQFNQLIQNHQSTQNVYANQQSTSSQYHQLCINFQPSVGKKTDPIIRLNGSSGGPKTRDSLNNSEPNYVNLSVGDYIVIKGTEASSLYKCVNHVTSQVHLCKIVETKNYHNYLSIYIKLQDNRGINKIHEICVGSIYTIIVFEKSYGDLHSYIRMKKKLTETEARKLFHQITAIVADCHAKGIILRDIKLRKFIFKDPQQTQLVLETWDDAVILTDRRNDLLNDKHGCPTYVSPEILSKSTSGYSGRSADCWSLGVILFTMLAGRYPFHDSNPSQLFTKIRRGVYQIPSTVSCSAEFIIRSLLHKQPSERLTAQDLLYAGWFSERDAYLEPDDLLPESRLLEADEETRHEPTYSPRTPSFASATPASTLSYNPSTSSTRPFSIASILSSSSSLSHNNYNSQSYASTYSPNAGSSVNEPKPHRRLISSDQVVPDINWSSNSDEPFHWTLTSGLLS